MILTTECAGSPIHDDTLFDADPGVLCCRITPQLDTLVQGEALTLAHTHVSQTQLSEWIGGYPCVTLGEDELGG